MSDSTFLSSFQREADSAFDAFIDSLPRHVGETPRDVLKQYLHSRDAQLMRRVVEVVEKMKDEIERTYFKMDAENTAASAYDTGMLNALSDLIRELTGKKE